MVRKLRWTGPAAIIVGIALGLAARQLVDCRGVGGRARPAPVLDSADGAQ